MKELAEGRASIAAHLEKARRLTARWHELETQAGGAPALEVAYARHYGAPPGVGMAHVSSGGGPMVPMRFYHGVGYEAPAFRPEVLEAMRQHDEEHERRMAELTARLDQARTKTRRGMVVRWVPSAKVTSA